MFEFIQIAWDIFMLRDSARKGRLKLRAAVLAFVFVVLLYGTGVPAAALYQNHPQYKPLFLSTMAFDLLLLVAFIVWAIRYNLKIRRERRNPSPSSGTPSQG